MTSTNGRTGDSRRSGRSVGQWMLGLLIVLAVAASILMVFTDELSIAGSLAVIAALWAAVIGAILVTKFRRQTESVEAKNRDLRLVYELQLEREIAARRQYELDVEMAIRKEVGEETNVELVELKAQVLALRSSLESLIGEPLPEGRTALPTEKVRELASGLGGSKFGGTHADSYGNSYANDDVVAARDFAERVPAPAATAPTSTAPAGDQANPNEQTTVIPVIGDDAPVSGRIATEVPLGEVADADIDDTHPAEVTEEESSADEVAQPVTAEDTIAADESATGTPAAETPATETPAKNRRRPTGVGSVQSWFGRTGSRSSSHSREAAPYSGTWSDADTGGAAANASATTTEQAEPGKAAPEVAPEHPAPFVDDTPTDEWERQAAQIPDLSAPDPVPAWRRGRHEGQGGQAATTGEAAGIPEAAGTEPTTESGGRRRRTDDAPESDGGHSVGRPAAELLNALRESGGSGRRRRQD